MSRASLGRGLSALLGDAPDEDAVATVEAAPRSPRSLPVEQLRPGRFQPRRLFDEAAIAELVESVREKGVLQPLLVRPLPEPDTYEIIAGERRWRAAQMARLHEVPVVVREFDDRETLEVSLVENLQREDLTPLEEAEGYRRLMDEFAHTQEDLGRAVGKSRSHVANMMRLLALPDPVKDMLDRGALSMGHARALLGAADAVGLAAQVATKGLSVRQTERLAREEGAKPKGAARPRGVEAKDPDTAALERDLSNLLGLEVSIKFHGKGGELTIHYGNLEQLDDVLHRLSQTPRRDAPIAGGAVETAEPVTEQIDGFDMTETAPPEEDILAALGVSPDEEPEIDTSALDALLADDGDEEEDDDGGLSFLDGIMVDDGPDDEDEDEAANG
ncbi:MAG: ParB/RepB/Spo0J family partition protein [Alphaproteobacteria bacterium]|nr:ParB/RepB/Spo0J family partition protein [Alphaproteobacteria bacterium]